MAAVAPAPYSHAHFQSLPTLEEAKSKFLQGAKGEDLVASFFRDFFVKEGMDRTFGLSMLHRHFDLGSSEKLVDYQGTSTPWNGVIAGMQNPQPTLWSFDDDGLLRPTEFRYAEKQDAPLPQKALIFIAKFRAELDKRDLTKLVGLARYPGDEFQGSCEFSMGRSNINLKPEDYPADLKHIPTIWFFSEGLWKRGCRCTCNASSDDHPHGQHVITTSA
ncbi:hypothetical protein F4808DRAFT_447019 [Astrocystis sublimbata]|nr:hypothetical protein F4808DRAFT_447019 [Astrocystis sublimbata]